MDIKEHLYRTATDKQLLSCKVELHIKEYVNERFNKSQSYKELAEGFMIGKIKIVLSPKAIEWYYLRKFKR